MLNIITCTYLYIIIIYTFDKVTRWKSKTTNLHNIQIHTHKYYVVKWFEEKNIH